MRTKKQEAEILVQIRQAVARGWCYPANEKRVMDTDLAKGISQEVSKLFHKVKWIESG